MSTLDDRPESDTQVLHASPDEGLRSIVRFTSGARFAAQPRHGLIQIFARQLPVDFDDPGHRVESPPSSRAYPPSAKGLK